MSCYDDLALLALHHEKMLDSQKEEMEGHIMACERCSAKFKGISKFVTMIQALPRRSSPPHPDPAEFLEFLENRRKGQQPLHAHFGRCDECLGILSDLASIEEEPPPARLRARVLELNLAPAVREARERRRWILLAAAAAVAAIAVVALVIALSPGSRKIRAGPRPPPAPVADQPRREAAPAVEPIVPEPPPKPLPGSEPESMPEPEPEPRPEPEPEFAPEPKPKTEPSPPPPPPPPPPTPPPPPSPPRHPAAKAEPEPAPASKPGPVEVRLGSGVVSVRRGALHADYRGPAAFVAGPEDLLVVPLRVRAHLRVGANAEVIADEGGMFSTSLANGTDAQLHLHTGRMYVAVAGSRVHIVTRAVTVSAERAEVVIVVARETTRLLVLGGQARFGNEEREVILKAGEESYAYAAGRPALPSRIRAAEDALRWSDPYRAPEGGPRMECFGPGNRAPAGLVIAVPRGEEKLCADTGAEIARRLDAALVVAIGYGSEGRTFAVDSPVEGAGETEAAREVFEKFHLLLRETVGAGEGPVPFLISLRTHEESVILAETAGLDEKLCRDLRDMWVELCKKSGREPHPELKVERLDPQRQPPEPQPASKGLLSVGRARTAVALRLPFTLDPALIPRLADWIHLLAEWIR